MLNLTPPRNRHENHPGEPSLVGLATRAYAERLDKRNQNPRSAEDGFADTPPPPPGELPSSFSSSLLNPALLTSVLSDKVLGSRARPTAIQALSLAHVLPNIARGKKFQWSLASETGSGKSLAYLLPMLQLLKSTQPDVDHQMRVKRPGLVHED